MVDGEHAPPPNPDNGGDVQPPRRPDGCRPGLPTPAEKVWGRLGLLAMPTLASTEHSRASLRSPPLAGGRIRGVQRGTGLPDPAQEPFWHRLDGRSKRQHAHVRGRISGRRGRGTRITGHDLSRRLRGRQTVQGEGGGMCPTAAGAQGGTIHGGPVQADVLAREHRTRPGHCPSYHTSSLRAYGKAQGHGPTRSGAARIPAPRLAQPAGVVELDHAANRDLGAPAAHSQGVCGAPIPRVLEGASPRSTGETETETHGSIGSSH